MWVGAQRHEQVVLNRTLVKDCDVELLCCIRIAEGGDHPIQMLMRGERRAPEMEKSLAVLILPPC